MGFDGAEINKRNHNHSNKKQQKQSTKHPADAFIDQPGKKTTQESVYRFIAAGSIVAMICAFIFFKIRFSGINDNAPKIKTTAQSIEPIKEQFIRQTKIQYTWTTLSGGNVLELDLHIINSSNHTIKDPSIICSCSGQSGTIISAPKKTLYNLIPANTDMNFGRINMGFINPQTSNVRCDIYNLKIQ